MFFFYFCFIYSFLFFLFYFIYFFIYLFIYIFFDKIYFDDKLYVLVPLLFYFRFTVYMNNGLGAYMKIEIVSGGEFPWRAERKLGVSYKPFITFTRNNIQQSVLPTVRTDDVLICQMIPLAPYADGDFEVTLGVKRRMYGLETIAEPIVNPFAAINHHAYVMIIPVPPADDWKGDVFFSTLQGCLESTSLLSSLQFRVNNTDNALIP